MYEGRDSFVGFLGLGDESYVGFRVRVKRDKFSYVRIRGLGNLWGFLYLEKIKRR